MQDKPSLPRNADAGRSEEVSAIIERMPSSFGVLITALVVLLAAAFFGFGWFIKYPEVLKGEITVNTKQAPVRLVANANGKLQLLKEGPGQDVASDEYVAIIKNAADPSDVRKLDSLLSATDIHHVTYEVHRHLFPEKLAVGELNNKYFTFLNALYQYLDYFNLHPLEKQRTTEQKLLANQKELLDETIEEYLRLKEKSEVAGNLARRDSLLLKNKIIADADMEKSRIARLAAEQEFKAMSKEISTATYQLNDATGKIEQINVQIVEKERELKVALINTYFDLKENIREWERKYVFIAPFKGKLDFTNFLRNDQYVQAGQEVFTVIPAENELTGQVFLPEEGSGKLKMGQDVIVKLENFPYREYGSVTGKVKGISLVTNQQQLAGTANKINVYQVNVVFPNGLTTNYGTPLAFHFETKGTAEIITEDRRLIERLFDNLRYKLHQTQ